MPLIVLTADRPPELRDWGAAQTIDQIHLFGSHAKWFADLPIPTGDSAIRRHARATAARAFQTAAMSPAGPIHLNIPYREPLLPETMPGSDDLQALYAFFMTREPVRNEPPANALAFPFNIRMLLAGWKMLFFEEQRFRPDPAQSAEWNRGAYLTLGPSSGTVPAFGFADARVVRGFNLHP
mgnify:CR=1 FL=1